MPGVYVGTFACNSGFEGGSPEDSVPIEGDVSFTLMVNTTKVGDCPPSAEFCEDLVIAESSSTLAGMTIEFLAFQATLSGGLDCRTGRFQASVPDGAYGLPEPQDSNMPDGAWKVADPAVGRFTGTLMGTYMEKSPQEITGDWALTDPDLAYGCTGPWQVKWTSP